MRFHLNIIRNSHWTCFHCFSGKFHACGKNSLQWSNMRPFEAIAKDLAFMTIPVDPEKEHRNWWKSVSFYVILLQCFFRCSDKIHCAVLCSYVVTSRERCNQRLAKWCQGAPRWWWRTCHSHFSGSTLPLLSTAQGERLLESGLSRRHDFARSYWVLHPSLPSSCQTDAYRLHTKYIWTRVKLLLLLTSYTLLNEDKCLGYIFLLHYLKVDINNACSYVLHNHSIDSTSELGWTLTLVHKSREVHIRVI